MFQTQEFFMLEEKELQKLIISLSDKYKINLLSVLYIYQSFSKLDIDKKSIEELIENEVIKYIEEIKQRDNV